MSLYAPHEVLALARLLYLVGQAQRLPLGGRFHAAFALAVVDALGGLREESVGAQSPGPIGLEPPCRRPRPMGIMRKSGKSG